MGYVCKTLTEPDSSGIQTCTSWQEQNLLGLPNLTVAELAELTVYIILACLVAWCFRLLGDFIKSFK